MESILFNLTLRSASENLLAANQPFGPASVLHSRIEPALLRARAAKTFACAKLQALRVLALPPCTRTEPMRDEHHEAGAKGASPHY